MPLFSGTAAPQELLVRYNKAGQIDGRTNLELPPVRQRIVEVRGQGLTRLRAWSVHAAGFRVPVARAHLKP